MSASNKGKKPSKADRLIEEAVKAVEAEERLQANRTGMIDLDAPGDESQEIAEKKNPTTTGPVARIDLQQYVEKEAYLRLAADYENFRKRAQRDRVDAERSGRERILRGFLEILDNLERGLSQSKEDNSPVAEGMRMVLSQCENWLRSEGLERVVTVGQPFDPALHEAISQREDADAESGTILEEAKRGYKWHDRLLRPACVVVCKNETKSTGEKE